VDPAEPEPSKDSGSWIPRRLRERHWFWPRAAWLGFCWFGRIVGHPLSSFMAWVVTLATIFLGGIALHVSPVIISMAVILVFLYVVARGARLKWERDRGSLDAPKAAAQIGTYMHEPHFHFGENTEAAATLLRRISSVETDLPVPEDQPPVHEPEAQDDEAGSADE
jgi:hypothetical protein